MSKAINGLVRDVVASPLGKKRGQVLHCNKKRGQVLHCNILARNNPTNC